MHTKKLNIALLSYRSHPFVGGQGIYIKYLSRALHALGHTVDVLSGPPYPQLDQQINLIKIPSLDLYEHYPNHIRAFRWSYLGDWANFFEWASMATGGFPEPCTFGLRVAKYLKQYGQKYDVIHDNQSLSDALLTLQDQGFPVISSIHHPITRDRRLAIEAAPTWGHKLLTKRWYHFLRMQTRVAKALHHVTTVSEFSRQDIANQFGRSAERTKVISNGVDSDLFKPNPTIARLPYRIITTTSSDQAIKGFQHLLDALALIKLEYPTVQLRVIGKLKPDGPNEKRIKALQLENNISFVSGISDSALVQEYAQAHVAVCPSLYEGFGLPAAEAMSCGVPLVSSNGGALAEVVGDAGILCPAGDSGALAAGIHKVFKDPDLARDLSQAGRARVEKYFCWQRVAQKFSDYYQTQFSL